MSRSVEQNGVPVPEEPNRHIPVSERKDLLLADSPLLTAYLTQPNTSSWYENVAAEAKKYESLYEVRFTPSWEKLASTIYQYGRKMDIFKAEYSDESKPYSLSLMRQVSGLLMFMGYEIGSIDEVAMMLTPVTEAFVQIPIVNSKNKGIIDRKYYDFVQIGLLTGADHKENFDTSPLFLNETKQSATERPIFQESTEEYIKIVKSADPIGDFINTLDLDDFLTLPKV